METLAATVGSCSKIRGKRKKTTFSILTVYTNRKQPCVNYRVIVKFKLHAVGMRFQLDWHASIHGSRMENACRPHGSRIFCTSSVNSFNFCSRCNFVGVTKKSHAERMGVVKKSHAFNMRFPCGSDAIGMRLNL
jgi:hypothetical protein